MGDGHVLAFRPPLPFNPNDMGNSLAMPNQMSAPISDTNTHSGHANGPFAPNVNDAKEKRKKSVACLEKSQRQVDMCCLFVQIEWDPSYRWHRTEFETKTGSKRAYLYQMLCGKCKYNHIVCIEYRRFICVSCLSQLIGLALSVKGNGDKLLCLAYVLLSTLSLASQNS